MRGLKILLLVLGLCIVGCGPETVVVHDTVIETSEGRQRIIFVNSNQFNLPTRERQIRAQIGEIEKKYEILGIKTVYEAGFLVAAEVRVKVQE